MIDKMEKELIFETLATLVTDIKDLRKRVERFESLNYAMKMEDNKPFKVGDLVELIEDDLYLAKGNIGEVKEINNHFVEVALYNGIEYTLKPEILKKVDGYKVPFEEGDIVEVVDNESARITNGHDVGTVGTVVEIEDFAVLIKNDDGLLLYNDYKDIIHFETEYDNPFNIGETVKVIGANSDRIHFGFEIGTVGTVVDVSAYAVRIKDDKGMELWNDMVDLVNVNEVEKENIKVGDRVAVINSESERFGGHKKGTIGTVAEVDGGIVNIIKDGDEHGRWSSKRDITRI